jgi:cobalt/nickel transport system ATP-binding protein
VAATEGFYEERQMSDSIIQLKKLCFAYDGIVALLNVDLDIEASETIVLQGTNGCGKTTLLKILNGLIFAEEGEFVFEGRVIDEKTMRDDAFSKTFHQKVGFIFQNADVQLFCGSVEEEIAFGPRQMGLSEDEVRQRVDDVIELLQLEALRERPPYHLSGGEKRKVALACVLSMNPKVLVMDEPLASLDQKTKEWLSEFLLALKNRGKTMIISTHHEELARMLADRIVYMNDDHEIERIEKMD